MAVIRLDLIGRGCDEASVFPLFHLIGQPLEAGGHHKQSGTHLWVSRAKRELPQPCGTFEVSLRPRLLLGYRHSLQPSQRVARSVLKVRAEGAVRAVNLFGDKPVSKSITDFRRTARLIKCVIARQHQKAD
jgi:hypothetical protein